MSMAAIDTLIGELSNRNVKIFFENKITSFRPEKEVYEGLLNRNDHFSQPIKIGQAELADGSELLVFSCESKNTITARSSKKQQFEIARKVLKEDFKDGAIFVFYDNQKNFRFSFIRRFYGEEKKYTNWKRFTYYVRPDETNKTFKKRLNDCSFKGLDAIQEAFSVEKLTKEFYSDLFNWYQWVLSEEVGATFPENLKDKNIHLEEQIIRLITRLLFVWFIRQKRLIPGNLFEVDELKKILNSFDPGSKKEGNYYNAILQNLFFATLNKPIEDRGFTRKKDNRDLKTLYRYSEMFAIPEKKVMEIFKPIPFLNGGLFECLDKEESTDGLAVHLDGFSRNADKDKNGQFKHRAFIPNMVFFGDGGQNEGLIPLLNRYNFTVEENVPNEVQVALDPELLGNVFENLLGTFNPETKETARNESGSFYTPRDIVGAMVKESLFEFLKTHLPKLKNSILRAVVEDEELPAELMNDHALCGRISDALRSIKILDPACGSGAYPMGILNKMVQILEKLDVKNKETHYNLKLHLIEECIYGVDIQTIAAQISKLRFFISLIVEQEQPDLSRPEDNYGVITLPNLETKFVSANTLISPTKENTDLLDLSDQELKKKKAELLDIRKKHFYANSTYKKMKLRKEDEALRKEIEAYLIARDTRTDEQKIKIYEAQIEKLKEERKEIEKPDWVEEKGMAQQASLFGREAKQVSLFRKDKNAEKRKEIDDKITNLERAIRKEEYKAKRTGLEGEITEILKWDPYNQNKSSEWFDPEWMFGVSRFDVVIGNPPYIQLQKALPNGDSKKYADLYKNENYTAFERTGDIYALFYERGLQLTKEGGVLCYITSNKWMRAAYGASLRKFFAKKNPLLLIDLGPGIFNTATVDTNIILLKNEKVNQHQLHAFTLENREQMSSLHDVAKTDMNQLSEESWIILKPEEMSVKKKIEQIGTPLKKWDIEIYRGVLTGYNEAFIIDGQKRKELIKQDPKSKEIIKPILRGKDIKRYKAEFADLWLIFIPWHFPLQNDPSITGTSKKAEGEFNRLYPAVYNHLLKYKKELSERNRAETGIRYEWYALQRCAATYYKEFEKEKIVFQEMVQESMFTYDNKERYFCIDTGRILTGKSLKYLVSIFNSKLFFYCIKLFYAGGGLGSSGVRMKHTFFIEFPMIEADVKQKGELENLVDTILSKKEKNEDTISEEQQIDLMVYRMYTLTYDEVLIVDPEFGMNREEYAAEKK